MSYVLWLSHSQISDLRSVNTCMDDYERRHGLPLRYNDKSELREFLVCCVYFLYPMSSHKVLFVSVCIYLNSGVR